MNLRTDLQEQIEALWMKKDELMDMTDNAFDCVLAGLSEEQMARIDGMKSDLYTIHVKPEGVPAFEDRNDGMVYYSDDLGWEDKYSILGDIQYELNKE